MLPRVTMVSVPPRKPCFSSSRTEAPSRAAATAAASPAEPPPTTNTSTRSASPCAAPIFVIVMSYRLLPGGRRRPGSGSALGRGAGGPHRFAPLGDLGTDEGGELLGAVADDLGAEAGQPLAHVRHG